MTKEFKMPASYADISEEEMTYTQGGSVGSAVNGALNVFSVAATVVGAVVLGSSYIWGISQAREWLSVEENREGNWITIMGRYADFVKEDMTQSPANFLRDAVSSTMVVALAPLSLILVLV